MENSDALTVTTAKTLGLVVGRLLALHSAECLTLSQYMSGEGLVASKKHFGSSAVKVS